MQDSLSILAPPAGWHSEADAPASTPCDGNASENLTATCYRLSRGARIILLGYWGFRNFGDDLYLRIALDWISEHRPDLRVTVIARNRRLVTVKGDVDCIGGVGAIAKTRKFYALLRAEAMLWIGGTCLYECRGHSGLRQLEHRVALAKWLKIPFHFVSIGIGETITERGRRSVQNILRNCASASFREARSFALALGMVPSSSKFSLAGDLTALLDVSPKRNARVRLEHVGFSGVRDYAIDTDAVLQVASTLKGLVSIGATIHFFALHEGIEDRSDHAFHHRVAALLPPGTFVYEDYASPSDLKDRIYALDFHIGMRLHSVLLCDLFGVPGIGLASSPKIAAYLESVGASERCFPLVAPVETATILSIQSRYCRPDTALRNQAVKALRGLQTVMSLPLAEPTLVLLRSTSARYEPVLRKRAIIAQEAGLRPVLLYWVRDGNDAPDTTAGVQYEPILQPASYGRGVFGAADRMRFLCGAFCRLRGLRPNIIHACDFDMMLVAALFKVMTFGRVRVIYEILDFIYDFSSPLPRPLRRACCMLDRLLCRVADGILIPDENRLVQLPPHARRKSTVVYNSCEVPHPSQRSTEPSPGEPLTILYAGGFSADRGLPMLMEAVAARCEQYRLVLAGQGTNAPLARRMAAAHSNILYLGQIDFSNVAALTAACDLLYAMYDPSWAVNQVASPNKFFEAIAFGKPIIVSEATSIDRRVRQLDCGWVSPYSPEALGVTLDAIDRESARRKGRNAAAAREVFGWSASRRALSGVYRSLA